MNELVRPTPRKLVLLWRGATRACPVCGRRHLTRRVVGLRPACPRCGFVFERDPGHFVGAVGMNTMVTFGLILISILVGLWALWPDMNFVGLASVPLLIAVIVPPLFHPTAKTLWVGIDLMMNPVRPGEAVADLLDPERLFTAEGVDTEEGPPEQG